MTSQSNNFYLIVVAAGKGLRLGADIPKQYITLNEQTVLRHTLNQFTALDGLSHTCVVIHPDHEDLCNDTLSGLSNISICHGGKERKDSVLNGLNALPDIGDDDVVLIHDAARPFVKTHDIQRLLDSMHTQQAATLAHRIVDTLRYADQNENAENTVNRENLWAVQTPQAFHYKTLRDAHAQADGDYTDDTALVSAAGVSVKFIESSSGNFKITTTDDLNKARLIMKNEIKTETRTGLGYDVHAFDENVTNIQSIRLCGVDIAHDRKLKGHSDADVGLHTLTDAILGAIGEGDIGLHFPPSNMDFKNMDSAVFLEHAMKLLRDKGGKLVNADVTLICESPKIGQYRTEIVARMADILNVSKNRINIKATTTEQLGFTGRKEGIAAQAAVSIELPQQDEEM
ncbi:MAG: bifunctional 2-C-methyl-D-erythritol 4-phosphate cytidylyltransferase/2-C-methyl-D-erythritol 2,4-cyclodiphosphate synthase [Alphaproteobacteria bacterium]